MQIDISKKLFWPPPFGLCWLNVPKQAYALREESFFSYDHAIVILKTIHTINMHNSFQYEYHRWVFSSLLTIVVPHGPYMDSRIYSMMYSQLLDDQL